MKLVFATNNTHKLYEIRNLVKSSHQILSLSDINCFTEIPEDFDTIEANAAQKARFVYDKYGFDCFADDTGLEVISLGMRPGVYSARYAGNDANSLNNMNKLLAELAPFENRKAQFRTVVALIIAGELYAFEGIVKGVIINEMKGKDGFGYDPIFVPNGYTNTFAELSIEIKNTISHRAIATQKLLSFLNNLS